MLWINNLKGVKLPCFLFINCNDVPSRGRGDLKEYRGGLFQTACVRLFNVLVLFTCSITQFLKQ